MTISGTSEHGPPPRSSGGSSRGRHASALRVYDLMRAAIVDEIGYERPSLTEDALGEAFGASRTAVRSALNMLAEDGLVLRRRRVGTQISGSIVVLLANELIPTVPGERMAFHKVDLRLEPTTQIVRTRLGIDEPVVGMIEALVTIAGRPICIRSSYMSRESLEMVRSELPVLEANKTLEAEFDWMFGEPLGHVETYFEATESDERTARLLDIPPGSALLVRQQLIFDRADTPRLMSFTHFRSDRAALFLSDPVSEGRLGDAPV